MPAVGQISCAVHDVLKSRLPAVKRILQVVPLMHSHGRPKPRLRIATLLHQGDAEHIRTNQQRETADGNGQIDLIHGDLSEMASIRFVKIHESRFYTVVVVRPIP